MKRYYCDQEARAICRECGRASCKEHGTTTVHHRHVTTGFSFICNECSEAYRTPGAMTPTR
jgi:hypothetical protein